MAYFSIGEVVRNVGTNRKGTIAAVLPARRGLQLYRVFYSESEIQDEDEMDLERIVEVRDMFDVFLSGTFRGYSDFMAFNTTFKIENSSNNTLSSLKASKTLFKTYQYIPLMKFLASDVRRLLIADEVGLGKTIEAGHIMLEMKARGELRNVLVVCPSSLKEKWRGELEERFGLSFIPYENKRAMKDDLRGHAGSSFGIITYESLSDNRLPVIDEKRDSKEVKQTKRKTIKRIEENSVLKYIEDNNINYSLVVCDEAHRVRNMNTTRYNAVDRLLRHADAGVFLTATPIMLGRENLFSLLSLLHRERYEHGSSFEEEMRNVEPIVMATNALAANKPLDEIRDAIEQQVSEDSYMRSLGMFGQLIQHLREEDSAKTRTSIQSDLYDLNPLSSIMTRTRKVDVTEDYSQAVRETIPLPVKLYNAEQTLFDSYRAEWDALEEAGEMEPLARSTRERQIASSVYAYERAHDAPACTLPDAKCDKLMHIIKECRGKAIVFVGFKATLYYLSHRLTSQGIAHRFISGDDRSQEDRIKAVEEFRNDPNIRVLISTQVGGEGLDMQFCDTLINYDLPWNPMEVEQRIGRIDRIGQKSPIVHIYTLLVDGSVQAKIHARLLERIEPFRRTIGDLEPILSGKYQNGTVEEAIEELYRTKLTESELNEKMRQIERAIERNLADAKQLERELSNSFTSDSYLRERLNTIIRKRSYVTEREVESYVRTLFRKHLPTCTLSQSSNGVCTIGIPLSDPKVLLNFLMRYSLMGGDKTAMMNDFINTVRGRSEIRVTFIQQVAEENRSVAYLNIYHPLVLIAKEVYEKEMGVQEDHIFRYCVEQDKLDGSPFGKGYYVLANYSVNTEYNRYGRKRNVQEIFSVVYDLQKHDVSTDERCTDALCCAIQSDGMAWQGGDAYRVERDDVEDIRVCMNRSVHNYCDMHRRKVQMQQSDDIAQQRHGVQYRYQTQINEQKNNIEHTEYRIGECNRKLFEGHGDEICWWDYLDDNRPSDKRRTYAKAKEELLQVLPAMRGRLQSIEAELNASLQRFEAIPEPLVSSKLMSINLIHII